MIVPSWRFISGRGGQSAGGGTSGRAAHCPSSGSGRRPSAPTTVRISRVADARDDARLADLVPAHDLDHVELEHRRAGARTRGTARSPRCTAGRSPAPSTSIAAPSPQPPNSAPVPEIRLGTTGIRHGVGSAVGSRPKNVRASIGAGGYPAATFAPDDDSLRGTRWINTGAAVPDEREARMIASVHIADMGARSALAVTRKAPRPGSIAGLRSAAVGLAAPLGGKVVPRSSSAGPALIAFWDDDTAHRPLSCRPPAGREVRVGLARAARAVAQRSARGRACRPTSPPSATSITTVRSRCSRWAARARAS